MTYQPVLVGSGNTAWTFLKSTQASQKRAFENSAQIVRDTDYFKKKVADVKTVDDLVSDRRLLSVALGAFGLDEDIGNRYFIRKVLQEGVLTDDRSFANRLADKRYFRLAEAFAFDLSPPNTGRAGFADSIVDQYQTRQFEISVGAQDDSMRLALGIERDLAELAARNINDVTGWFVVMGTPTMRSVFETALGLPSSVGAIDIDKQASLFQTKSEALFGVTNPAEFSDTELQEQLIRQFLFRTENTSGFSSTARGSVALSLLQSQTN